MASILPAPDGVEVNRVTILMAQAADGSPITFVEIGFLVTKAMEITPQFHPLDDERQNAPDSDIKQ